MRAKNLIFSKTHWKKEFKIQKRLKKDRKIRIIFKKGSNNENRNV